MHAFSQTLTLEQLLKRLPMWRRQFILSARKIPQHDDHLAVRVADLILYHCRTLPVSITVDQKRRPYWILGLAFQSDPNELSPQTQLANFAGEDAGKMLRTWMGRWILVSETAMYMDAGGSLGVFLHFSQRVWGYGHIGVIEPCVVALFPSRGSTTSGLQYSFDNRN